MRNVIRATSLLAVVAALIGCSGQAQSDAVAQPAKFTRVPPGWRTFQSDFGVLGPQGVSVESYALSWRYDPGPSGWANRMPRDATAITVLLLRRPPSVRTNLCKNAPHLGAYGPILRLPLVLPKTTSDRLEGAPDVLEYRVFGRMDESYNVDLRVDVRSLRPTREQLRRAQDVVNHIRFPRWPRLERC
jgi:hypothetical protein